MAKKKTTNAAGSEPAAPLAEGTRICHFPRVNIPGVGEFTKEEVEASEEIHGHLIEIGSTAASIVSSDTKN